MSFIKDLFSGGANTLVDSVGKVLDNVITLLFFYILIFKPESITSESKDIVLYILGVLSAILTQVYSYYFGSSAGSAAKSVTLASMRDHK
ncbi:MAG: hypothetical protein Q8R96_13170 [Bacteroidota bacterium]|nr:hypothetical protein [Bacteroidota bacterium]